MNVLHISSSDSGGAGIAAHRLHHALMESGVDSKMLCLNRHHKDNVYTYNVPLIDRLISHLPIPYRQNKYRSLIQDTNSSYESTTFPEAIYDISNHPLIQEADIINLHWVGGMLNYPKFFRSVKKPIVWTLHDMNPFLGFAHYEGDRERNSQFAKSENKVRSLKLKAYSQHDNITVVNLCRWMYDYSSNSEAFKNRHHAIIPNSIDTSIFKNYDQISLRTILDLPLNKPVIMFCCQSLINSRKGFDLLLDAFPGISSECFFLVIGNNSGIPDLKKCNIKSLGTVSDEKYMALLYAASDVHVLPSREDNLPNTMLESLCCGTPVISFSNGGMRDIIKYGFNGILVKDQTGKALAEAINNFIATKAKFDRNEIIKIAHAQFAPQVQANRYMELYNSIVQ